ADYSNHPERLPNVYDLANNYWYIEKIDKAKELYEYVSENSSDSGMALKGKAWVAGCEIKAGNYSTAEQLIDTLIKDYSQHSELLSNVYDLANNYWYRQQFDKAKKLYEYFSQNSSDSGLAIDGQALVAGCEIESGNDSAAEDAIKILKTIYAYHPKLHANIYELANKYWTRQKFDKAKELYQYVSQNNSDSDLASRGQAWVASCNIKLGNDSADPNAFDLHTDLLNDHAFDLHTDLLNDHPQTETAMEAQAGIALAHFAKGDYEKVSAAYDKLLADYKGMKRHYHYTFMIPEEYYFLAEKAKSQGRTDVAKDNYAKAKELWIRGAAQLPNISLAAERYYFAARCCKQLSLHDEAITHYEKVVESFPDSKYASSAQFQIGECYRNMTKKGELSKAAGNVAMKTAYKKLIQDYPKCKAAAAARTRLSQLK
ncbi:MAG: tetratricopeptide repeat protein, partial [Planctomycetes bacterium]|nr:tetratricopeptide repeat protein [Planctomycetota bacterium]